MYQGSNPIAIRSQKRLTDAVLLLLKERTYSSINVKNICATADLSRQTFYQLFSSKEEVLCYCIREHLSVLQEFSEQKDLTTLIPCLVETVSRNRGFIRLLYQNNLEHLLSKEVFLTLIARMEKFDFQNRQQTKKLIASFLSAALSNLLLKWSMEEGVTEQELIVLIQDLLINSHVTV